MEFTAANSPAWVNSILWVGTIRLGALNSRLCDVSYLECIAERIAIENSPVRTHSISYVGR